MLVLLALGCPSFAVEYGTVKYNDSTIDYSVIDKNNMLNRDDSYFEKDQKTTNKK